MFDFLINDQETDKIDVPAAGQEFTGPNLNQVVKMTRKKFGQDILEVYEKLGGPIWLLQEARADPKAFFDMLKKMIPNPTLSDAIADIAIKLINQYIERQPAADRCLPAIGGGGSGQPSDVASAEGGERTATSGNPDGVEIIEVYPTETILP